MLKLIMIHYLITDCNCICGSQKSSKSIQQRSSWSSKDWFLSCQMGLYYNLKIKQN